jgi:hypothetical protein
MVFAWQIDNEAAGFFDHLVGIPGWHDANHDHRQVKADCTTIRLVPRTS